MIDGGFMAANPFIHCQTKNGKVYAAIYTPRWENGKKINKIENLGLVIDKDKGYFRSRARGLFQFDLVSGFSDLPESRCNAKPAEERVMIFGDVYVAHTILKEAGYIDLLREIYPHSPDTLIALTLYRLLNSDSSSNAIDWWNGTYAKELFPEAQLQSQRISEHLSELGDESLQQEFFRKYLANIYKSNDTAGVLIDSTGLPNCIHIPETQISNHNGVISNEMRLIYVVDRATKMPIFFRAIAGNIIDVTTLKGTLEQLKSYKVNVAFSILDAGYYSENNIKALYGYGIDFITRMVNSRVACKELLAEHCYDIIHMKNRILYNNRLLYCKKNEIKLFENKAYAYVFVDFNRMHDETVKLAAAVTKTKNMTDDELEFERKTCGMFVIVSSIDIDINEILSYYYSRQAIEQVFDVCKNNINLLPIRCHNAETTRGHLFVSFITSVFYLLINAKFKATKHSATNAFSTLHYLLSKKIDNNFYIDELNRKMKEVLSILKISIPTVIPAGAKIIEPGAQSLGRAI
jgi:hypothetical protein